MIRTLARTTLAHGRAGAGAANTNEPPPRENQRYAWRAFCAVCGVFNNIARESSRLFCMRRTQIIEFTCLRVCVCVGGPPWIVCRTGPHGRPRRLRANETSALISSTQRTLRALKMLMSSCFFFCLVLRACWLTNDGPGRHGYLTYYYG